MDAPQRQQVADCVSLVQDQHSFSNEKKRRSAWEWEDSYQLLQLLDKHGKNWEKILEIFQNEQHRLTDIAKEDAAKKLRKHYYTLSGKNSTVFRPYVAPPWKPPHNRQRYTNEQLQQQQVQHIEFHAEMAQQRKYAQKIISKIEDREILHNTTDK